MYTCRSMVTSSHTTCTSSLLLLDRKEELVFSGKFVFSVKAVGKVYSAYSTISVDLHCEGLDIIGTISIILRHRHYRHDDVVMM